MKRVRKALPAVLVLAALCGMVYAIVFAGRMPGQRILAHIPMEDVSRITIHKTVEDLTSVDAPGMQDMGTKELTPAQMEAFFRVLAGAKLRDIGNDPFGIHTDSRYEMRFYHEDGMEHGRILFYGDRHLLFSYYEDGDRPFFDVRCKIRQSDFDQWFASIFPAH